MVRAANPKLANRADEVEFVSTSASPPVVVNISAVEGGAPAGKYDSGVPSHPYQAANSCSGISNPSSGPAPAPYSVLGSQM